MQQNGRFHWEVEMRQRDALEHGGRGGCCAYPAEHLTVCLYALTVCTPALGQLYIACTQCGTSSSHMHTHAHVRLTWVHFAPSDASLCLRCPHAQFQTRTNLAAALSHSICTYGTASLFSLPVLHTQYSRQCRDALSQRDAQQNENGKEYCRQTRTMGLGGERSLAERPSAVEAE